MPPSKSKQKRSVLPSIGLLTEIDRYPERVSPSPKGLDAALRQMLKNPQYFAGRKRRTSLARKEA